MSPPSVARERERVFTAGQIKKPYEGDPGCSGNRDLPLAHEKFRDDLMREAGDLYLLRTGE